MQLLGSSATRRPSKMQPDKDDKLRVIDPSDPMWEELEGLTVEQKLAIWPPKTKPLPTPTTRPAPSRPDFSTDAEWEESMARWQSTVGRNKAIAKRAWLDFRLYSESTGK